MEKIEQRRLLPPALLAVTADRPQSEALSALAWQGLDRLPTGRLTASAILFCLTLFVTATSQHMPGRVTANDVTLDVRALVPLAAALLAVLCVWRPMPAFAAILALTPAWNSAQIQAQLGPFQVIDQTILLLPLLVGCAYAVLGTQRRPPAADTFALWPRMDRGSQALEAGAVATTARSYRAHTFVEVACAGIVALAVLSTLASADPATSANVLLHGILEPVAMAAVLVLLRPSRREIAMVAGALGFSVAAGSVLSLLQSLNQFHTLADVLANRLYFSWYSFGNVGSFGVIVAAVLPLEVGLLAAKRRLNLSGLAVGLLLGVTGLSLMGLFFSLSKSAWLSAFLAMTLLTVLLIRSWRRRAAITAAVVGASAFYVPWPALVLQSVPALNSAYRTAIVGIVGQSRFDSWNPATLTGHGSMAERFYAVEGGIRMALDHPLLGVGLGQFASFYVKGLDRPSQALDALTHAHSVFPEVAAELGLVAALLLAVVAGGAAWSMWRVSRTSRDDLSRMLGLSILAGLGAWFLAATAYGCVIYTASTSQASDVVVLAVLVGMAIALARVTTSGSSSLSPQARR